MPAFIVARIHVHNADRLQDYGAAAAPTVAAHGGEFVLRGKHAAALLGEDTTPSVAIIQFPTADSARSWFASPEYQALAELRDAAARMEFTLFQAA